jgi:hypothetical protein
LTAQVFFSILIKLKKKFLRKMPCTQNTCGVAEAQGCACGAETIAVIEKTKKSKRREKRERAVSQEEAESGVSAAVAEERNSCGLNESCRSACLIPDCAARERNRYANDTKPYRPATSVIGLRSYGPVEQYPHVQRVYWGQLGPHN